TQSGFSIAAPATSATLDSSAAAISIAIRQTAVPRAHHGHRFNVRIVRFLRIVRFSRPALGLFPATSEGILGSARRERISQLGVAAEAARRATCGAALDSSEPGCYRAPNKKNTSPRAPYPGADDIPPNRCAADAADRLPRPRARPRRVRGRAGGPRARAAADGDCHARLASGGCADGFEVHR